MTIPSQINTVETKGKKVASTAIATTSKSTVVSTNVYPQAKLVSGEQWEEEREIEAEKLEGFTANENKTFSQTAGQFMSHHYR